MTISWSTSLETSWKVYFPWHMKLSHNMKSTWNLIVHIHGIFKAVINVTSWKCHEYSMKLGKTLATILMKCSWIFPWNHELCMFLSWISSWPYIYMHAYAYGKPPYENTMNTVGVTLIMHIIYASRIVQVWSLALPQV